MKKFLRRFSIYLVAILAVVMMLAFAVSAEEITGSYTDNKYCNMSWSYDTESGVCIITSSNTSWTQLDLSWMNSNWSAFHNKYRDAVKEIVIVKAEGAANVSKIVSDSGRGFGFTNLTKITLPNNVSEWTGAETFANATKLETLGVAGSITDGVIDFSFGTATNVNTVFAGLKGAKILVIPQKDNIAALPAMTSLTKVIIPVAVTSLSEGFFDACTALETVELKGTTIEPITNAKLADRAGLEIIVYDEELKNELVEAGYTEVRITVELPEEQIITGSYKDEYTDMSWSFNTRSGICTITNNKTSGWTKININWQNNAWYSFYITYKNLVKEIAIVNAEGATNIGEIDSNSRSGFGFPNLKKVVLPHKIAQWTATAFDGANKLVTFGVSGSITEGVIDFSGMVTTTVNTMLANFKNASTLILPAKNQTTALPEMPALTKVVIPAAVSELAAGYFANCTALTTVAIEGEPQMDGVVNFYNILGAGNNLAENGVFAEVNSVKALILGSSYSNENPFVESNIPENLETIYGNTEYLRSFCEERGIRFIPYGKASDSNASWTIDEASETLTLFGNGAVNGLDSAIDAYASSVKYVIINASITELGDGALSKLSSLKSVSFEGNAPTVASGAKPFGERSSDFVVKVKAKAEGFDESTWCGYVVERIFIVGDINDDSVVDIKDAVLLSQYLAKWNVKISLLAADTNGDGSVDIRDAVLLVQYLANWDVELAG